LAVVGTINIIAAAITAVTAITAITAIIIPTETAPMHYAQLRLLWCGLSLWAFVRRWLVYVVVTAAVFGAGAVGFLHIVMGAAAWSVLPLFYASTQGVWLVPAALLQALLGVALLWGLRQLLWPTSWAEAERALPLARAEVQRSDALVVLIALLPLCAIYAAGTASLISQNPAWLRPTRWHAVTALVVASALSLVGGVWFLQRLRLPAGPGWWAAKSPDKASDKSHPNPAAETSLPQPIFWSLLCLPLWRGPARRTGWLMLCGGLVLWLPALAIATTGLGVAWWLAAFVLLALLVATRINHLSREELGPMLQACAVLPLHIQHLHWARASLGLWPVGLALLLLCGVLVGATASAVHLRPWVLFGFVLSCLAVTLVEVLSAPGASEAKAARWLFSLALCVALATEVVV
jgi:hypothetical protein